MMELDGNDPRWTDEARESFRVAAANLVEAVRQHSATLLELTGTNADADAEAIAEAGERVEAAASAYADAQFELSGTVPPLGLDEDDEDAEDPYDDVESDLEDDLDDDLEEGDVDEHPATEDAGEPMFKLTVLHRADFVVTDELAVIQAGKEAYHDTAGTDDEPLDVADLSEAVQQLRHAGGIETLADTPGLSSAGTTTWILEATDLLDEHDADEWPESPFDLDEDALQRLLHRLDEVAG